jgi:hypothetical protein
MIWGLGVVAVLAAVTWWLRTPESAPLGRAFGALVLYGSLFLLTLLKIWWTGGRAAVSLGEEKLAYQPLHTFSPRTIAYRSVLSCAPRQGTQSLRLIHTAGADKAKQFFLNLAVVDGLHEFLDELAERLEGAGLRPVEGERHTWVRPGWVDPD